MSSCCLSGKIQEGKPKGRVEEIGGLQTYVAEPEDGSKKKTVIFLVDSTSPLNHAVLKPPLFPSYFLPSFSTCIPSTIPSFSMTSLTMIHQSSAGPSPTSAS